MHGSHRMQRDKEHATRQGMPPPNTRNLGLRGARAHRVHARGASEPGGCMQAMHSQHSGRPGANANKDHTYCYCYCWRPRRVERAHRPPPFPSHGPPARLPVPYVWQEVLLDVCQLGRVLRPRLPDGWRRGSRGRGRGAEQEGGKEGGGESQGASCAVVGFGKQALVSQGQGLSCLIDPATSTLHALRTSHPFHACLPAGPSCTLPSAAWLRPLLPCCRKPLGTHTPHLGSTQNQGSTTGCLPCQSPTPKKPWTPKTLKPRTPPGQHAEPGSARAKAQ